jgi:DNA repair protein RadC
LTVSSISTPSSRRAELGALAGAIRLPVARPPAQVAAAEQGADPATRGVCANEYFSDHNRPRRLGAQHALSARMTISTAESALLMLPRERGISDGFDSLADSELVAVLLGTGEKGRPVFRVATDLLEQSGGVVGLARMGPHALAQVSGVGLAKAARVGAAFELGRRVLLRSSGTSRLNLASSAEVARWARLRLSELDHEQVWMLALDGRNGLRAAKRIAEGGLHGCSVDPRDVLRAAVREAASAFVLVHNHPSGDPTPSEEDIELTNMVARAASVLGTPLVDHVIIAGGRHTSLFDLGVVAPPEG